MPSRARAHLTLRVGEELAEQGVGDPAFEAAQRFEPCRRRAWLGPVAEVVLGGAAAAGVTKLSSEIVEVLDLGATHGTDALLAALGRLWS